MSTDVKPIAIWVTQLAFRQNAIFVRWTSVWLHHKGEILITAANVTSSQSNFDENQETANNQSDIFSNMYHVRFSRWILQNETIGSQGITDGDVFILVTKEQEKLVEEFIDTQKFPINIPSDIAPEKENITMLDIEEWKANKKDNVGKESQNITITGGTVIFNQEGKVSLNNPRKTNIKSSWANGSFYLATFIVVIVGFLVLAKNLPFYSLVVIILAAILFVPLIGVLQIFFDKRISEKGFLKVLTMVIKQLPLIGKFAIKLGTNK